MPSFRSLARLALAVALFGSACTRSTPAQRDEPARRSGAPAAGSSAPAADRASKLGKPPPSADLRLPAIATVPDGFIRMTVGGVAPTAQGNAVLLIDQNKKLGIAIFIGDTEALAIQLRLEKRRYERPLTHDLLDSMLTQLGGHVESVRVDKVQDNIYFGTVIVTEGTRRIELDSRSSDAVALAVGSDAPIFVAKQVVDRAAVALEQLENQPPPHDDVEPPPNVVERHPFTL